MTIHNIAFQGRFDVSVFPFLGFPPSAYSIDGVEYYGGVGFLKAGLASANAITTVSPGYAREIQQPASGMGLEGLMRSRKADLSGILNGIDPQVWNSRNRSRRSRRSYDEATVFAWSSRAASTSARSRAASGLTPTKDRC